MSTLSTFVCDCGFRLNFVIEPDNRETTIIRCPNDACQAGTRHLVSGKVLQAFVVNKDGVSRPYDWKAQT
jgi:hypothetical protein